MRLFFNIIAATISFFYISCYEIPTFDNVYDLRNPYHYGSIIGKITNPANNKPVSGVNVKTNPPTVELTTDTSGGFSIEFIPPRQYSIFASKTGYTSSSTSVVSNLGATIPLNINLSMPLTGKITGSNNLQGLQGASVNTVPATSTVITDANGNFVIPSVFAGNYTIEASKNGYQSNAKNISIIEGHLNTIDIQLTIIQNTPCPGTPTINYSGKVYNTVQIGSQCWFKENLDVGTMINSVSGGTNSNGQQTNNGVIEKYCYNNSPSNCNTYGGLYQWDEVTQYTSSPSGQKGICPTGWHVPAIEEFQVLISSVGYDANKLKKIGQGTSTGIGTDSSGFAGLLCGNRNTDKNFYAIGIDGSFWSSTINGATEAQYIYLYHNSNTVFQSSFIQDLGFSVRCIKD